MMDELVSREFGGNGLPSPRRKLGYDKRRKRDAVQILLLSYQESHPTPTRLVTNTRTHM